MKKLLIIGAGFLQDFVILKSRELGYYTIAIDGSPDAIGLGHADKSAVVNIVDKDACLEFARQEQVDGVMTAATEYGVLSASYVAQEMNLPGLNYTTAQLVKNKYEVRRRFIEANVDDTHEAYEITRDTDLSGLDIHYPVMVKPCDGSGSRAAARLDNGDDLEEACRLAVESSLAGKALIESFVEGREYGAESLVINGEVHVLGVMKKWMTDPPYYAELGHQIPSELPEETEKKVKECVKKAIIALGINQGAVNMDLIITESGNVHIIDVGARMGGNMIGPCIIPIGTGIPYLENLIRSTVGDKPDWTVGKAQRVATKLLAFKGGTVQELPDFEGLEKKYNVKIYHHMHKGDKVNEYHTNLDGCGYIIATGDNALETAETVLNEISKYVI